MHVEKISPKKQSKVVWPISKNKYLYDNCYDAIIKNYENSYKGQLWQLKIYAHNFLYLQQQLAFEYSAAGHHPVFVLQ